MNKYLIIILLIACFNSCTQEAKISNLYWLEGSYQNGEQFEEWRKDGDALAGIGYSSKEGRDDPFETMEINKKEGKIFCAITVKGQNQGGPIVYDLIRMDDQSCEFENLDHDFPKNIKYQDLDSLMIVRLAGVQDGEEKSLKLTFKRLGLKTKTKSKGLTRPMEPKESKLGKSVEIQIFCSKSIEENVRFYKALGFSVVEQSTNFSRVSDGAVQVTLAKGPVVGRLNLSYFGGKKDRIEKIISNGMEPSARFKREKTGLEGYQFGEEESIIDISVSLDNNKDVKTIPIMTEGISGKFGELALPVKNLKKAQAYFEKLGFKTLGVNATPYNWAIVSDGLMTLGLHETDHFSKPAITYFGAKSKEKIAELKKAGLEIENIEPMMGQKKDPSTGSSNYGVAISPEGFPVNLFYGSF